jgi:5-methyltetrahydrofolate--homocysteine methyltransferase
VTSDKAMKDIFKRTQILDGAMGTSLAKLGLASGCNEELNLSQPDAVGMVHRDYLLAGADIITTNTFGGSRIGLADYGLAEKVREINLAAAKIARDAADSALGKKRFVAGDIGPTSKLPTLGHIAFDDLFEAYREQMNALVDGGVDIIIIETCQDPLQTKAALAALSSLSAKVPAMVSVTVQNTGTMLLGTELAAALSSILPYRPIAFGLNCAVGPRDMEEHLSYLQACSSLPILCQPNAGLPQIKDGLATYDMSPEEFSDILSDFVERFGIAFAGGCCGTTPEHINLLAQKIKDAVPVIGRTPMRSSVSSLFSAYDLAQEPRPFIVAEQTNVNGSKKFRDLLIANDFEALSEVARDAGRSSHALDICLATPARAEAEDFKRLIKNLVLKVDCPVMIDSTDEKSVEWALGLLPGRSIINSINLEDGGEKANRLIALAKKYGACLVALVIDEQGMGKTFERKMEIVGRIVRLVGSYGIDLGDLMIDTLTFTLASGDKELKGAGKETLRAIAAIKEKYPDLKTILGVSNISYGLPPQGRKYLTSVFLNRALSAGLDAAIINPKKIVPFDKIPEKMISMCTRLIDDDDCCGDPLAALLATLGNGVVPTGRANLNELADVSPAEKLAACVADGRKSGLGAVIEELLCGSTPTEIINGILLPAMERVGGSFSAGKLPLPFVLESAETMRAAIDLLSPYMKDSKVAVKGAIALATVRGDVHDIGKNLVDAILSNNGYQVYNLGIKQSAAAIIDAVKKNQLDAIGLSGLLVSSTEVMREDLATFRDNGINIPVLCGGAALTRDFVESVLRPVYAGEVHYCKDAFDGFRKMETITSHKRALKDA